MVINLKSKAGRKALKPRKEPYWSRIENCLFIGYRSLKEGEGTWIARYQEAGKKQYRSLGTILDTDRGKAYDVAVKEARSWQKGLEQGVTNKVLTVEEICKLYIEDRRHRRSDASARDAEGRFNRLVYDKKFGRLPINKLTTAHVKTWVNEQINIKADEEAIRTAKDSANRNLTALKAALNLALKDRLVATDAGWKTVTRFKGVGRRRKGFLTLKQRTALLDECPTDLSNLVKALLMTGARPGELASASVGDFDKVQGTLTLNGKTGHRECTLSTTARRFFTDMVKGKTPKAPLLARADGKHWNKDAWKKPFNEAVKEAKLPSDIVLYTLRHVAITEMINSGMDSFIVAKLAGTSTAMIDKHYGQLRHDKTRKSLDAVKML